ncbi:hypothetical protein B5M42_023855 [Paenibacillus athensensis]|uniref:Nitrile hydratase subunit beta n=1 Tax=Paenibacillus athensensis TaxID=1967502 RepID=A0A4Y8PXR8_9BACL|nr:hypothetical protein [Paenibacillus athensensis]MCD1261835.1 hypothetical protein [Paenibacillus athensensis]
MNRIHSHLDQINLIGKLADMKEDHYQQTLALSTVIELLVAKGIITEQELLDKSRKLHQEPIPGPSNPTW